MNSIISRLLSFISMTACLTFTTGCVKEIEETAENEYLAFTVSHNTEDTKAAPLTSLDGDAGIIGYVYNEWPASANDIAPWDKLDNVLFEFDGDQLISKEDMIRWSEITASGQKLKVFAYAPVPEDTDPYMQVKYSEDHDGDSSTPETNTLPSIVYTSPIDLTQQKDIIAAVTEVASTFKKNIPLTFGHILTAVKFRAGFDCIVKSITVSNVFTTGTYTIGKEWDELSVSEDYTITFSEGKDVKAGNMITDNSAGNVLFLIPQSFDSNTSKISLTYINNESDNIEKTIYIPLKGIRWEEGRMITYTLHKKELTTSDVIYFDLAAGNVEINSEKYSGQIYVGGTVTDVSGDHYPTNTYYVYQSTGTAEGYDEDDKQWNYRGTATGWNAEKTKITIPDYPGVTYNSQPWRDFITNNDSVEKVIETWDDGKYIREDHNDAPDEQDLNTAVVRDAGRTHTRNYILITGQDTEFNLTIDNIYSVIQVPVESNANFRNRDKGGISYIPSGNTVLNVNFIGDNRMGCLHIKNTPTDKITLEGTGSLTVADTDFITRSEATYNTSDYGDTKGYVSNFWNSAIGNNTKDKSDSEPYNENVYNLYFKSGVVFAGTTKAEDATAIGGGGNGDGQIFINGGTVTAVATTAGTAIGGGMGHSSKGGSGEIHISGGNIYAYNFANIWDIPSAAIGGGGSFAAESSSGIVNISGGYVYAYSVQGTAIGGGSSKFKNGGTAEITITGGHIVAKSKKSNGIGGGTGGSYEGFSGGNAEISISGTPIIRTGSIGGGKTNNSTGHIGSATINISGGDIQAQFVMAAGASSNPSFTMTDGLIRNSDTEDPEFYYVQNNGGAVYLEDGTFKMHDGEIRQCLAEKGGAIYIMGENNPTFEMTGGKITECASKSDGGAVYLEGGTVTISKGTVSHNLANNGNGGGFCIVGGDFNMTESNDDGFALIHKNAALSQSSTGGKGGGIYVTSAGSDVNVNIISGSITDNSSDRLGGGICVDMTGNEAFSAKVIVGKNNGWDENPSISNNHTIILGGGLYAKGEKADITINSGNISNNTISGYTSNADVANDGGMVTLNGGQVTHVKVTYNNNEKYMTGKADAIEQTDAQKIVTATNSKMVAPAFERVGYILDSWNTRPDGKGTEYINGQTMNLSNNLTLYAQWRRSI